MDIYTGTRTSDVSLARDFQKQLSTAEHKHGVIDLIKYKKWASKKSGQKGSIMFRMMLMSRTNIRLFL